MACTSAPRSRWLQASDWASVRPSMRCQPPSSSGAATPTPTTRLRNGPSPFSRRLRFSSIAGSNTAASGNRYCISSRSVTRPRKSTSSQSALRRPILMPIENAPSGFSPIGTDGCPTRPRTGASRTSNWSSSSRVVIRPMVCAVSPVSRASSALGRLPCTRSACSTTRSLNCRMPPWLEPRWRRRGASAASGPGSCAVQSAASRRGLSSLTAAECDRCQGRRAWPRTPLRKRKLPQGSSSPVTTMA